MDLTGFPAKLSFTSLGAPAKGWNPPGSLLSFRSNLISCGSPGKFLSDFRPQPLRDKNCSAGKDSRKVRSSEASSTPRHSSRTSSSTSAGGLDWVRVWISAWRLIGYYGNLERLRGNGDEALR